MRTILKIGTSIALLVGLSAQANAYFIGGGATDVGSADTVLDEDTGVNGDAAELTFINNAAGTSYTTISTANNVSWQYVDGTTDVIAFALASSPGHYIIKNATVSVAMANLAMLDWGVLDLNDLTLDLNLGDDFQISHVSSFGGGGTRVSEPAALSLLGLGLIGFGLSRRRRKAAA